MSKLNQSNEVRTGINRDKLPPTHVHMCPNMLLAPSWYGGTQCGRIHPIGYFIIDQKSMNNVITCTIEPVYVTHVKTAYRASEWRWFNRKHI